MDANLFPGSYFLQNRDNLYHIVYVAQTWAPPGQRNGDAPQVPSVYTHAVPYCSTKLAFLSPLFCSLRVATGGQPSHSKS